MSWAYKTRTNEIDLIIKLIRPSFNVNSSTLYTKRKFLARYLYDRKELSSYFEKAVKDQREKGGVIRVDVATICRLNNTTCAISDARRTENVNRHVRPITITIPGTSAQSSVRHTTESSNEEVNRLIRRNVNKFCETNEYTEHNEGVDRNATQNLIDFSSDSEDSDNNEPSEDSESPGDGENDEEIKQPNMNDERLDEILRKLEERETIGLDIEEFRGEATEDITEQIENVERIARINGWNNARKIRKFSSKLRGAAKDFFMYEVITEKEVPTWERIKEKMIEQFGRDENVWEVIIQKTKQKADEDPVAYGCKIIRLCRKQNPHMSEKAITAKVLNGMIPEQRLSIQNLNNNTLEKLKENLRVIKDNKERYNDSGNSKVLEELKAIRETMGKMTEKKEEKSSGIREIINLVQREVKKEAEKKEEEDLIPELINRIRLETNSPPKKDLRTNQPPQNAFVPQYAVPQFAQTPQFLPAFQGVPQPGAEQYLTPDQQQSQTAAQYPPQLQHVETLAQYPTYAQALLTQPPQYQQQYPPPWYQPRGYARGRGAPRNRFENNRACFICGYTNHIARDCRRRNNSRNNNNTRPPPRQQKN